ncbi:MAG: type I toxin-antitoxin system SymE family toxin [Tannerellaceae bacterium]|nr:type I toxin-antitoxin system SymE family toxin [Tannerellaceae bacterium]
MAKTTASKESKTSFKPRLLTLCCKDRKRDKEKNEWYDTPTVTLAGQWMYDAGFRSGQWIEITVQNRQLTIQVVSEPGERPPRKLPVIEWKQIREGWIEIPKINRQPIHHSIATKQALRKKKAIAK